MTTTKQVKQIIQPLLARNPDVALVGRKLVLHPIRHLWRGVSIDRTSTAEDFFPKWGIFPFFERDVIFGCNWGDVIFNPLGGRWLVDDPLVSATMCDAIERKALPFLRSVQTIEDFVAFATKERFPHTALSLYKRRKLFVDLALGDIQSARLVIVYCEAQSQLPARKYVEWEREEDIYITKNIAPLVAAEDRAGLARLLHGLEAEAVTKWKLHHLWEPTPFPIEMK